MKATASPKQISYSKLLITIFVALFYFNYATSDPFHVYANWNIIDSFDLIIHEAGHTLFSFLGEFVYVAGGSLLQIILPCVFIGYFFLKQQFFSASLLLFWLGQNVLYVATYMGDAIREQLPLLGGDNSIHDWNYVLTHAGLLKYTDVLSNGFRFAGWLILITATVCCLLKYYH